MTSSQLQRLWRQLSIEHKLAITVSLIFIIIMVLSVYIGYLENKSRYNNRLQQYGKIISNLVEQNRSSMMEHGISHPEITKQSTLISKTPSYLLNDISLNELAGIYRFISLTPLNPENAPDAFEESALLDFERGKSTDQSSIINIEGRPYYRYVQPLFFNSACLNCHVSQSAQANELRGAISLTFPIQNEEAAFSDNLRKKIIVTVLLFIFLFTVVIFLVRWLVIRPLDKLAFMSEQVGTGLLMNYQEGISQDQISHLRHTLINSDKRIAIQKDELTQLVELAERDSRIDPLTSVYNRRHLKLEAPKLYLQAQRESEAIATAMIDIDHFKHVNDTYGHTIGDECIKMLASSIKANIRPYDMFVRVGGEEFLLIMPNTDIDQAAQITERLRHIFEHSSFQSIEYGKISATISLGVYSSTSTSLEQSMTYADQALYKAKQGGRNQVQQLTDETIY